MDPDGSQPKRKSTGTLWRLVRAVLLAYLMVLLLTMWLEESLIYFPTLYPDGDWQPAGLEIEDAWFEAADGTKLHGWYVAREEPKAVVLFAHGNAGNLSHRIDTLRALHRRGVAVMIFDYRGYGRSEGSPSEAGVLADARAARSWLADKAGVAPSKLVLMGRSLGAAVMVDLAAQEAPRGLVLESTFTSLPDVGAFHYPWLPVRLFMRNRLESIEKIGDYHGPLLQCHGDADTIIPIGLGRRLFEAANEPKQFVVLQGRNHNDPHPVAYFDELEAFFDQLP